MAWTYTTGVLTSTGATEANPDSLLAGIAILQAADATKGYRSGLVAWLNNVEVRAGNSFIKFDADCQIELKGSSFINPQNGGVMHDYRSTYIISTTTSRIDNDLNFETGSTLLCRRERINDPNPKIVYNTGFRHDYPTILTSDTPAKVIIDGLDCYGKLGGGSNLKIYFGKATINSASNIRFFNLVRAQQYNSTYNDFYFELLTLISESDSKPVTHNRPTFYRTAPAILDGAFRACVMTFNNPSFLNDCWDGTVNFFLLSASSKLFIQYSYKNTFKQGLANVENVNVRFTRSIESVIGSPNWVEPNNTITAISDVNGQYTSVNLLDAYREGTSSTDLERYNWTAKARKYDKKTAGETIFASRVLFQHSVNMSAGYSEEVQMLQVGFITLTEAQALALTGISFTSSGATGGTVTISGARTVAELWQYYRAWISQTANFDIQDTWSYDGVTLNTESWNITNTGTITGNLSTTGTVTNTGSINGTYTDSTGTRVTIKTADNLPLSTYITIDGVPQAWQTGQTSRNIFVTSSSVVRIYAHSYGYQPRIINITGNNASDYIVNLLPETNVDTSLNETTRDSIAGVFEIGVDGFSRLFLSVNADLRQYTPSEVLNALHYFTVTQGAMIAAATVQGNTVIRFSLMRGGFIIASSGFYGKVADSVTTTTNLGILVPLSIYVDPSVYVAMPTYTPVEKNTSGIVLQYAPWTQQEADIPDWVARESSVQLSIALSV